MLKIDCHAHIGLAAFLSKPIAAEKLSRPALQDALENTVSNLIARMNANNVDRSIAVPFPLEEIDRHAANCYALEAAQRHPDRIIPFALVGDDTAYWLKLGARGFKQQNILYAPERFDLMQAYQTMAEAGAPMIIHFRAGPGYNVTDQVRAILAQVPTLKIIVAHMGRHTPNTSDRVLDALQGLKDKPNVIFETSTVRDPAMIARAVSIVGENRIVFGSDTPFNSHQDADPLAIELDVIASSGLAPNVQRKIFSENILSFLGCTEGAHDRHQAV